MIPSTGDHITQYATLVQRVDAHADFVRAWRPQGGVSTDVTVLEIAHAGGRHEKLLLRRYGAPHPGRREPRAAQEFALLRALEQVDYPAPRPRLLDESGTLLPGALLVVTYLAGATDLIPNDPADVARQMAAQLVALHRVDWTALRLDFLRRETGEVGPPPARLDESLSEGVIRRALAAHGAALTRNATVLLHGDFWPGNVVWQAGRIHGVIDWEDAALGDPLADVANARLELLWAWGELAMDEFTSAYAAATRVHFDHLAYWDLWAALRPASKLGTWGLDAPTETRFRSRHAWFVAQALARLPRGAQQTGEL